MAKSIDIEKAEKTTTKKKKFKLNNLYIIIAVLVVALAAGGYVGYKKIDSLEKEKQTLSDPQEAAKAETERIKNEIATLIEVPKDEEPTIATVVDPDKLGNQAFFANAEKDDRVVIYAKAKKAILYRPSTKRIVEVAPLNIGDTTKKEGATTPAAPTPVTDPAFAQ